jgi:hypothetical protein
MASLLIKASDLSVGDVVLLPWERTATVEAIEPFSPRSLYVRFRTEHGWTRVEVDAEMHVRAQVL